MVLKVEYEKDEEDYYEDRQDGEDGEEGVEYQEKARNYYLLFSNRNRIRPGKPATRSSKEKTRKKW